MTEDVGGRFLRNTDIYVQSYSVSILEDSNLDILRVSGKDKTGFLALPCGNEHATVLRRNGPHAADCYGKSNN